MADLQVCYFCGSGPGGSLGEYAVVPSDLDPTDDQQLSVVLCPKCRGKLTTVMEPVVEAAEATSNDEEGTVDADVDAGGDSAVDADDAASGGATVDTGSAAGDPTAADAPAEPGGQDDPVAGAARGEDDGSRSGDGVDVPPPDPEDDGGDEVSIDAGGAPANGETGPGEQPSAARSGESGGGESDTGDSSDSAPSPDRTPPNADDQLVGHNNEAYNKTLRLLQNREFPVERHEIEQVAANAYQLDPQEVSDAIDSLIQKGLLSQEGAHLQRQ